MNVSLTPELEQFVHGKVQSGLYHTASEVIREGLRLLMEREETRRLELAALRRDIQVGIDQADRGEGTPVDRAWAEDVKQRGRKRLASGQSRARD